MILLRLLAPLVLIATASVAQQRITPVCMDFGPGALDINCIQNWGNYYGQTATVCGTVVNTPIKSADQPTYLVLNENVYAKGSFRIVIPQANVEQFGDLSRYNGYGKFVCATGTIVRGAVPKSGPIPEMTISRPTQIRLTGKPRSPNSRCRPCENWDERQGRCVPWRACP